MLATALVVTLMALNLPSAASQKDFCMSMSRHAPDLIF